MVLLKKSISSLRRGQITCLYAYIAFLLNNLRQYLMNAKNFGIFKAPKKLVLFSLFQLT